MHVTNVRKDENHKNDVDKKYKVDCLKTLEHDWKTPHG